jgi:hypothetical protein
MSITGVDEVGVRNRIGYDFWGSYGPYGVQEHVPWN